MIYMHYIVERPDSGLCLYSVRNVLGRLIDILILSGLCTHVKKKTHLHEVKESKTETGHLCKEMFFLVS